MNEKKLVEIGNLRKNEFEYEEAYAYYLEAAIGECDPDAIENLGELYLYGSGVRTDYKKAFHYFRLYFDLTGKTNMFWPISEIRDEGLADPVWKEQYAELIEYTISNKAWEIYIVLADEYSYGGVYPKSIKKKIDCYEKAKKHGINMGSECLAEMYYLGTEIDRDYKKTYELLTDHEEPASFIKPYYLGLMYKNGFYVEKDPDLAMKYFEEIVYSRYIMKECDRYYEYAVKELNENL